MGFGLPAAIGARVGSAREFADKKPVWLIDGDVVGTDMQSALAQTGISVSYIGVETAAYVICAILLFVFFHVEDNLKEEQEEIKKRNRI